MNEGLSAADVMALRDGDNNWTNNPFIYLVWLALLGGGNGFFGRNQGYDVAMQNALTRSDLFEGFNNQDVNSQLRGITNGLCDGFYTMNNSIKDGNFGIQSALAELGFGMKDCCCTTNRNIDDLKAENYKNTCEVVNAIRTDGEATRALINSNTMQDLRDKLEERDRDLLVQELFSAQQAQTQNLINQLRPFPTPAYITCSPYTSGATNYCNGYGGCGA